MSENKYLSSFCHINDYREKGYKNLHRMIIASYPLILWAPSGKMLEHYSQNGVCRVSIDDFKDYIEKGFIKIIAREKWYFDKKYRSNLAKRFNGGEWHNLDDVLKSICLNDQNLAIEKQRVRIVEEEDGYIWADKILSKERGKIDEICNLIEKKKIPLGSIEKGMEWGDNKEKVAKEVLRDVRNHIRAFELANANVPIFDYEDARFFELLGKGKQKKPEKIKAVETSRIVNKIIEILKMLEDYQKPRSFGKFIIGGEGHRELSKYLYNLNILLKSMGHITSKDISLCFKKDFFEVLEEIDKSLHPEISIKDLLFKTPKDDFERNIYYISIFYIFLSLAITPFTLFGLCGVILSAIPIFGKSILIKLGLRAGDYEGTTRWPFLYTFGKEKLNKKELEIMGKIIKKLSKRL